MNDRDPELARWIKDAVAEAPPLTEEQRTRIAALLWGDRYPTVIDPDSDDS